MNLPRLLMRLALGERLPTVSGEIAVPGLDAPVTIRRDRYGVPHITAETEHDAWYALGFCQGQDRAFQLEMVMRLARGTVAELTGRAGLDLDRLSRRIGFRRSAERQLPRLDPDARAILDAFAQGVTMGATRGAEKPAHEYALLRAEPTRYEAADVLALMKYLSLSLSPWAIKIARLIMCCYDGPQAVQATSNSYPDWQPVTAPVGATAGLPATRLTDDLSLLTGIISNWGGASNNWAIAPSRTRTGRPLIANDPHLAPMIPSPWYLSHIRTPEWEAAGASLIGTPAIVIGHSEVAAWGVTAGMVDDVEVYLEEIGPDGRSVREGDGFVPCRVRQEFIKVRGQPPVEEEVLETPRGPIVGPALDQDFEAISLCATWLEAKPVWGFLRAHRARSFEEFREAFAQWPLTAQNVVYADTQGTIGWQLVGEVQQRRGTWGTLPVTGWEPTVCWQGEVVPFEDMPHIANPEQGYIATANNKPIQDGNGPFLGDNWLDGYRVKRINQLLAEREDWDVESVMRMQLDQKSLPWEEMREIVLSAPVRTPGARLALDLLREWDGVLDVHSPAATVYEFLLSEMSSRVLSAQAPRSAPLAMGREFNPLMHGIWFDHRRVSQLVRLFREQPPGWFRYGWPVEIADALGAAVRRIRKAYGDDPARWGWGEVRTVTLKHPLGEHAPFDALFNVGPFPCGGDQDTICQAKAWLAHPTDNAFAIPGLRMVLDVGNWDDNRFVLAGGQSGNPFSPHYDDQLQLWLKGEAMVMPWSEESVQAATVATLRLTPGR